MLDGTCEAPGCEKRRRSPNSTYCSMHHRRMQVHGTLADPPPRVRSICRVDGCTDFVSGRGLCDKHVQRVRKYGTTELPPKPSRPTECAVDECTAAPRTRGFCSKHAARAARHGDPRIVLKGREATLPPDATYRALHKRLDRRRGLASSHPCVDCGGPAAHWSYNHASPDERLDDDGLPYSTDLAAYDPRCPACHGLFDNAHLRVTQGGRKPPSRAPGVVHHSQLRSHCRRGHELTEDNIAKGTKRTCATCKAQSQRQAIERRKMRRRAASLTVT